MNTQVETNPSDEKLRECLLTDDQLQTFERQHPGKIRVLAVGRYNARVQVDTFVLNFTLHKWPGEERSLDSSLGKCKPWDVPLNLWALAWHRAAEAMLALRKGHMEYRRNRKLKAEAA